MRKCGRDESKKGCDYFSGLVWFNVGTLDYKGHSPCKKTSGAAQIEEEKSAYTVH